MRNRMNGIFVIAAVLTFFATSAFAMAPAFPPVSLKLIRDNVYYAEGGGGNSIVIVGQGGVILVDGKNRPPDGKQLFDEVAKLTNKPITTVIFTHVDPDHVRGLGGFPQGLRLNIIAHANVKARIERDLAAGGLASPPREYLPNRIAAQMRETLTIEGVRMTLIHVAPAHTDGDIAVYLPDHKIVASGDLISAGDPGIHLDKDGSSEGWIRFVTELAELDADTYVRGHADIGTREQVRTVLANARAKRARIESLVREGKSLDEIKTALGEPRPATPPRFPTFTETTYEELTRR